MMKTLVILFTLLCAACVAGEIMIALADHNDEDEHEEEGEEHGQ